MTLDKTDLQKFFKRLRKLCPTQTIKYYAVGEYGTNNKRPHYHMIFFNVLDSSLYSKAWMMDSVQIGAVHVGNVTNSSVAYTMKYIDKANFRKQHARDDRTPEFPLMSKKLGDNYLSDQVVKYHKNDLTVNYLTQPGGNRIALPRYYREKIYSDDERKRQHRIIEKAVADAEKQAQLEFQQGPYGNHSTYDYVVHKDQLRLERHKKFYHNQKNRDL